MNANINSVVVTLNGTNKKINVDNGMILVLGDGPYAGAFRVRLEEATEAELNAAEGEIIEEPVVSFEDRLHQANEELQSSQSYKYFEKAVKFLTELNADEFMELVLFAESHGNKFPKFCSELRGIINANDAWGSAWSRMLAPLNKEMQDLGHKLLDNCLKEDSEGYDLEMFYAFYDSVSTIARIKESA